MPTLKITNNSVQNPVTVDLSGFMKLGDDGGTDPYDPAFTQRIFSRSLLKEGASLALQQLVEKEQTWPLLLGPYANQPAMMAAIAQINQAINTPGAVLSWQDDGVSQPTFFDLLSGELQIEYSYRKGQRSYTSAKLLTFSQPLGRTAGSRPYAAASGVGPLLMISPYASGGALAIGASTQGGVAGFGGAPMGASSGVFYPGAPSLAGDAPAPLQISYVGPLPAGATTAGVVPYVAVSLLPDPYYRPLITAQEISISTAVGATRIADSHAVASQYISVQPGFSKILSFSPLAQGSYSPTLGWGGAHRLFAIARASQANTGSAAGVNGFIQLLQGPLAGQALPLDPFRFTASAPQAIGLGDWAPYDLGTITLRASEMPGNQAQVAVGFAGGSATLDVNALVMLPDNATWFFTPNGLIASQYGAPSAAAFPNAEYIGAGAYTNTLLLDDALGDQFIYWGPSQLAAPSPLGSVPSSARITQYTRGLVPRPDPKNGLPILAILGMGQTSTPTIAGPLSGPSPIPGGSWANPQNGAPVRMAQVSVLERVRYVLP